MTTIVKPDYVRLFDEFGPEKEFSDDAAIKFLGIIKREDWTYGVRTEARKHPEDIGGHYLCCPFGTQDRMIFTKNPMYLDRQFKRARNQRIGNTETLIPLINVMLTEGVIDSFLDLPWWVANYMLSHAQETKQIELEQRERELAAAIAAFQS
jgi:hypothetical protein